MEGMTESGTRAQIDSLRARMGEAIIGQREVIERLLIGLLANGNLLVEGLPGLAKTRAIKALARNLECDFSRIQFTPDLLPSDVTGTEVYYQGEGGGEFRFEAGPIFANLVLADEINRAPAKVQAALLEAMEERQVTVAGTTHKMEPLFMVMATQNPIEQEGTYPLPEAQMDRFLMHVNITYPPVEDEVEVIRLVRGEEIAAQQGAGKAATEAQAPIPQEAVFAARREIAALHVAPEMERYIADLVNATRVPSAFGDDLKRWIEVGASPRASLALDKCGRTHAWLAGRDYVDPEDIRAVVPDVLRHRLGLSYEAQGEGISPDAVVAEIVRQVALP
ncbi:MoxR family ATPase [Yangia sp. PrR002]|uniref:AAA family ATPase n=2 Tax=Roseobacteraceae TaxID=2854170 RepID=UPI0013B5D365|nr:MULTISPECIES: MoxR family ATPase [Roseobacteraceae]MCA0995743.1 MoxR family ATPase [Alloyangia pacifica]NDV97965.1 MoxR family ATPase [Salipiger sp. PrR002]NDW55456.1 MoxR family ATPase [Salipiger sp. PrR004]